MKILDVDLQQSRNIVILGAGNLGITLYSQLYDCPDVKVSLYSASNNKIKYLENSNGKLHEINYINLDDMEDADVFISTWTSDVFQNNISRLNIRINQQLIILPGQGIKYNSCKNINWPNTCAISPTPFNCRVIKNADTNSCRVSISGKKYQFIMFGNIFGKLTIEHWYKELFDDIEVSSHFIKRANDLPINPILHSARLLDIITLNLMEETEFYNFTDHTMRILNRLDIDISRIVNSACQEKEEFIPHMRGIGSFLNDFVYAGDFEDQLSLFTKHEAYRNIGVPYIKLPNGQTALDIDSRLFKEDVLIGLKDLIDRNWAEHIPNIIECYNKLKSYYDKVNKLRGNYNEL